MNEQTISFLAGLLAIASTVINLVRGIIQNRKSRQAEGRPISLKYIVRLLILPALFCIIMAISIYATDYVSVPNVIGLTYDNARQTLIQAGLECEGDFSPEVVVMDQSEPAGTSVKVGATITLFSYNEDVKYVSLSNLDFLDSSMEGASAFEWYESSKDNLGNTYQGGCGGESTFEENWQTYDVSQYKEIKGRVILNYESRADSVGEVYVKVYADDIIIWTSPSIEQGQKPVDFELDISENDTLKISIQGSQDIRLVDCYLYEEVGIEKQSSMKPPDASSQDVISLYNLDYWNASSTFREYDQVKDNLGNTYSYGYGGGLYREESWQEYLVGQRYEKIQGRIVLDYDCRTETDDSTYVKIYGDGNLLYTSPLISAGQEPVDFSVGIGAIENLRISIFGSDLIRLVDCSLYVNGNAEPTTSMQPSQDNPEREKVSLLALDYWTASRDNAFQIHSTAKDNLGNPYGDAIGGSYWAQDNWEEYYIRGEYKSIDGTIILNYDERATVDNESYVKIYTDDTLIYTSPLISAGQEPTPFHIDLSGVERLKISIYGDSMIFLVNTTLEKA